MIKFLRHLKRIISINNSIVNINNRNIKIAVNDWMRNPEKAETKYGHISNWNTSQVTTMKKLFFKFPLLNEPIGDWDVSNVTDMSYMFRNDGMDIGSIFNQPIGNWDVSKVTTMEEMFCGATSFNQDISTWNVSSVNSLKAMFYGATSFNQTICNWDLSNVKNISFMFYGAISFNQNLSNWNIKNINNSFSFRFNTPNWFLPKPKKL